MKDCVVARKRPGVRLELTTDYNAVGKILYLLGQRKLEPESSIYEADVRLILVVPQEECEKICKEFTEATAGKIGIREIEKMMYEEEISIPS